MRGRSRFSADDAAWIRAQLVQLRRSERDEQTRIRGQLRKRDFRISDWAEGNGFTASDFDSLIQRGQITVDGTPAAVPARTSRSDAVPRDRPARDRVSATTTPVAPSDLPAIIRALRAPGRTVDAAFAADAPEVAGLYAIHARDAAVWRQLGLGETSDDRPLYVGKAEASLASRDVATHFATGKTGGSSPRRSFAALLVDELYLTAIPRRPERPEPTKWTHYALEPDSDERLTTWMVEHLRLAVWPRDRDGLLKGLEADVMRHWLPPLNLTTVQQPWKRQVRDARDAMAADAKSWARARGFDG